MDLQQGTQNPRRKKAVKVSMEELVLMLRAYILHPSRWSNIIEDIKANTEQLNAQTQQLYRTSSPKQLRDRLSAKLSSLLTKAPDSIENRNIRDLVDQVRNLETRLVDDADGNANPHGPHEAQGQANPPAVRGEANPPVVQGQANPRAVQGQANLPVVQGQDSPPAVQDQANPPAVQVQANAPAVRAQRDPLAIQGQANPPALQGQIIRPAAVQGRTNPRVGNQRQMPNMRDRIAANLSPSSSEEDAPRPQQQRRRKRPLAEIVRENHKLYSQFMKKKMPKILRDLGISSSDDSD